MMDEEPIFGRDFIYLDTLTPVIAQVGYGSLGVNGSLGYEGKQVTVRGQNYSHALSAHPPARLQFYIGGRFSQFSCQVAINDDVHAGLSHADFLVLADGRQVASAAYVLAGDVPSRLDADIAGAHVLELVVQTTRWEYCHAVWLEPQVDETLVSGVIGNRILVDCLQRTEIRVPDVLPHVERCIATVVSPGFERLLDDMLGSLYAYGGCQDALVVVITVGSTAESETVIAKYNAFPIHCQPLTNVNPTVKSALYSIGHLVAADKFICLDADMLVLGDLRPIFATLDACPEGAILAVREGNGTGWHTYQNLQHALQTVYGGRESDIRRLLGKVNGEGAYTLVVNDGIFAGTRAALLALDGTIRRMQDAPRWTDERRDIWWRNQFVFNVVLAQLQCAIPINNVYNIQLNSHDVLFQEKDGHIQALWYGHLARVLHFNGLGRNKYPEWRDRFAQVSDPLVIKGGGDQYGAFVSALRAWIGRFGLGSLAWSFYGKSDAQSAAVQDPDTFPLLAALHYLIRSNGCVRVLETGTAYGVSTACLASALAHRQNALVVSFDSSICPAREALWASLPKPMRNCIETRPIDSLQGMQAAIESGEQFHAALLDSLHTEEHIWAEFQLASRLVCPGGLILIHDVTLRTGTMDGALQHIQSAGYGVTRLWTAECGVVEDDRLGLAVIENRPRLAGQARTGSIALQSLAGH